MGRCFVNVIRRVAAELVAICNYRRFQREYWDLRSRDIPRRYRFQDDFPILEKLIKESGAKTLADVGCGQGRNFALYAKTNLRQVTAVELSRPLLEEAKAEAGRLSVQSKVKFELIQADLRRPLPLHEPVDVVVAARVLQHLHPNDVEQAILHICEWKPKWIYINEIMRRQIHSWRTFTHPYEQILGGMHFSPVQTGELPVMGYEYVIFQKRGN